NVLDSSAEAEPAIQPNTTPPTLPNAEDPVITAYRVGCSIRCSIRCSVRCSVRCRVGCSIRCSIRCSVRCRVGCRVKVEVVAVGGLSQQLLFSDARRYVFAEASSCSLNTPPPSTFSVFLVFLISSSSQHSIITIQLCVCVCVC
uniref:Uncharacterized protein n=1 Tax=Astyanax mexicanus TaxID=7994 RepID=A0A3B1IGF4_ASTMX